MNSSEQTKAMVEGSLMAVIATILGLATIYLPFAALVTTFLISIPIIILIKKHTLKSGVLSLLVTTLLLIMLSGNPLVGLLLVIQFGGIAIVYGIAFKNHFSPGKTILVGGVIFLLSLGVSVLFTILLTGINPFALLEIGVMKESLEPYILMMGEAGQFNGAITEAEFRAQLEESFSLLVKLIPVLFIITSFFSAYLNYVIARLILKRLQFSVPDMKPFREWRLPWFAIWVLILGIGLTLLGDQLGVSIIAVVGQNLVLAGAVVFLLIGLAYAVFFYQKSSMARFLKIIMIIFLIINLAAGIWFLIFVGVADTLFNLRRFLIDEENDDKNDDKNDNKK